MATIAQALLDRMYIVAIYKVNSVNHESDGTSTVVDISSNVVCFVGDSAEYALAMVGEYLTDGWQTGQVTKVTDLIDPARMKPIQELDLMQVNQQGEDR